MKTIIFALTVLGALPGCAASAPAEPNSPATATQTAQAPDNAKARTHLEAHVQYPADRAKILAACAQTKEFTDSEKRWLEQNLPEGNYQSAADVIAALKL